MNWIWISNAWSTKIQPSILKPWFMCLGNTHNLQALTLWCWWRGTFSLDGYLTRLKLDYYRTQSYPHFLSLVSTPFSLYLPKHSLWERHRIRDTPEVVGEKQRTPQPLSLHSLVFSLHITITTTVPSSSHLIP